MLLPLVLLAMAAPQADAQVVMIPVTVTEPMGRFVSGLSQEGFRVFEDGVKQKISFFQANGASGYLVGIAPVKADGKQHSISVKVLAPVGLPALTVRGRAEYVAAGCKADSRYPQFSCVY